MVDTDTHISKTILTHSVLLLSILRSPKKGCSQDFRSEVMR